jgi:hypothetical protein
LRDREIRTASVFPFGRLSLTPVLYIGDPIIIGGVANITELKVFDAVYTTVRGKPFAERSRPFAGPPIATQ